MWLVARCDVVLCYLMGCVFLCCVKSRDAI